jgi:hypothetical protein
VRRRLAPLTPAHHTSTSSSPSPSGARPPVPADASTPPQAVSAQLTLGAPDAGQLVLHSAPAWCANDCDYAYYDAGKSSSASLGSSRTGGPFFSGGHTHNLTSVTDNLSLTGDLALPGAAMWAADAGPEMTEGRQYAGGQLDFGRVQGGETAWWSGLEERKVGLNVAHVPWTAKASSSPEDPTFAVGKVTFGCVRAPPR